MWRYGVAWEGALSGVGGQEVGKLVYCTRTVPEMEKVWYAGWDGVGGFVEWDGMKRCAGWDGRVR